MDDTAEMCQPTPPTPLPLVLLYVSAIEGVSPFGPGGVHTGIV